MRNLLLSIFGLFLVLGSYAQKDLTLYSMDNLFQKRYLNPAIQPKSKLHIGLPVLSSVSLAVSNTGFNIGHLLSFNGETEKVNTQELIGELDDINTLGVDLNIDAFSLGFGVGKNYISLSVRERINYDFNYSKGLAQFLLQGNAQSIGETLSLNGTGINFNAYLEMALGFSRQINDKLGVGATIKVLQGQANISTEGLRGGITTEEENYAIRMNGDLTLKMNGFDLEGDDIVDVDKLIEGVPTSPNQGIGVDLGATYRLNNKITLAAAIIDLGSINWSEENSTIYENAGFDFTYEGENINDIFGNDESEESTATSDILDSLTADIKSSKTTGSYSTPLNTQLVLSGAYQITPKSEAGLMLRNFTQQETGNFAATAYYGVSVKDWLSASINASYLNRSISNVGLGLMFRLGTFQIYGMADNVLGLVIPESTRTMHVRAGMNLIFGGHRSMFDEIPSIDDKATDPEVEIEKDKVVPETPAPEPSKEDKKKAKQAEKEAKAKAKEEAKKAKSEKNQVEEDDDSDSGLEFLTPAELEERKKKEAETESKNALEKEREELLKAKEAEAKAAKDAKAKAKEDAKAAKAKAKEDAKKAKEEAKKKAAEEKAKAKENADKETNSETPSED